MWRSLLLFPAFYGVLFADHEEAAFSNYRLWESLGFILAYVMNNVVCVRIHAWSVSRVFLGNDPFFIPHHRNISGNSSRGT